MKKTQKMLVGVLLMGVSLFKVFPAGAGIVPPSQKCESYDLIEEVSYLIDPDRRLSLAEEVKYRPCRIIKHIEKCHGSQITTVINPSEVWQPWMPQPVKTIADASGVAYYDAEGTLMCRYAATELAPGCTEELSWEDEVEFELSERIYASAEKNKAEIVHTDTGYQMKGEDFLLEVNQNDLITVLTFFDKGEYVGSEKVFYTMIDGKPSKRHKVDRSVETDTDGTRVEKIVVSTYSNYKTI